MSDLTPLDHAHAAMQAAPTDDAARLRFYERLAASELFLMLAEDAGGGDQISPEIFEVAEARYVLVFDREERLAGFAGQTMPYVALSGRVLSGMLAGQRIGLGVNLDVAPSAILLPDSAVEWLHRTLGNQPDEVEARIAQVHAPKGLPEELITAIDSKLATAMGLAKCAYLVATTQETGAQGHMLGFVGAVPEAEAALARAAAEALTFSTVEAGAMDVGFFRASDPMTARMERVGLRFDLPQVQEAAPVAVTAPGLDPDKPPRLR
ncbi:SseB family protein [Roseobacter sp. YSTF-M11]|uniref:SseB family protein n=1 Tax=Roseobacter insulae TaxID=2859783 RepID=A0A9X1FXK1_9RHOB|nr:SseB family protein [Roseobacter insulae]MBW4709629.1 SseB family protein [Roseobacter insulae]